MPGAVAAEWPTRPPGLYALAAVKLLSKLGELRVSGAVVLRLAQATTAGYALLVVTGGAVRLTGSGLGCSDWPACFTHQTIPAISFHPWMEFGNRMVTVAVTIVSIAAFLAMARRRPFRRDLFWPASGLIIGLAAQIVIGGIVVLTKLNPYWVAVHFLITFVMVAVGLVLCHRAALDEPVERTRSVPLVGPELRWLTLLLLSSLSVVIMAGTVVSGSGPHEGAPGTERIPIAFQAAAELHADLALFTIGLVLASVFAFRQARAPAAVQRRSWILLEVLAVQGVLGYTQYFLHDNALVVGFHMAGATIAWVTMWWFLLSLHEHVPIPSSAQPAAVTDAEDLLFSDEASAVPAAR
jgi:cytochrome c oxidase assembly protein subunit 15